MQISMSLSIEGFPKKASVEDRKTFANWLVEQAKRKDSGFQVSLKNTKGDLSNIIMVSSRRLGTPIGPSSSFQFYIDNYVHRKKKQLFSVSTGRATNTEMNLRKTLSENARMRGYFLKAAMEASNEIPEEERPEFFPSWNEHAVKSREYQDYLVWLHFSYATATCRVFVDEPLFDTFQATFEDKLEQISPNKTQTKGKGKGNAQHETRKGRSKGVYAGLDFSFDAKIPFGASTFQCMIGDTT